MIRFTASLCRRSAASLLVLLGSWVSSSQAANYTTYSDQTTWAAVVHGNFFKASIITTSGLSGAGPPSIYYYDQLYLPSLQNSGSTPLGTAFGGNFDLTPGGNGGGLAFLVNFTDSTSVVFWGAVNYPSGFWGIVSDTTIASVQYFSNALTGQSETFNYDLLTLQFPVFHICFTCFHPPRTIAPSVP